MVTHVFAGRSAELCNRANPLLRFINWCGKKGYDAFRLEEDKCYEFALDSDHAAPTFLRGFLVSVTFSHFVLGLSGIEHCMNSLRLQGIARQSFLGKQKRRQRQPLTAIQVRKMPYIKRRRFLGRL